MNSESESSDNTTDDDTDGGSEVQRKDGQSGSGAGANNKGLGCPGKVFTAKDWDIMAEYMGRLTPSDWAEMHKSRLWQELAKEVGGLSHHSAHEFNLTNSLICFCRLGLVLLQHGATNINVIRNVRFHICFLCLSIITDNYVD